MPHEIEKLAVVYLAGPRGWVDRANGKDWPRLDCLEASLKLLAKFAPPFPVVIFHEDLLDEDKRRLEKAVGRAIRYEPISFKGLESEYEGTNSYGGRVSSYNYRMMCRFFCGVMQSHPALSPFSHYLRLDDDSYLLRPVPEDAVERIFLSDYTYIGTCNDPRPDIKAAALQFLAARGIPSSPPKEQDVPYNNYHTASLRLWKNPIVSGFMSTAQQECLRNSWNDAPVHLELIRQFCPALGYVVHREKEVSYRHNQDCQHNGLPHTDYCNDGTGGSFPWGHPVI